MFVDVYLDHQRCAAVSSQLHRSSGQLAMPPLAGLHVVVHQAAETDLSLAEHTRLASSAAAVAAVGALGILAPDAQSVPEDGRPSPVWSLAPSSAC